MLSQLCRNVPRVARLRSVRFVRMDTRIPVRTTTMMCSRFMSQDKSAPAAETAEEEKNRLEVQHREILRGATKTMITPTSFDKIVLTWSGRFATKEEIPEQLDLEIMNRARDKMRVMTSIWLLISTFVGCIVTVKIAQKKLRSYHAALDERQKEMWAEQDRVNKEKEEQKT